MTDAVSLDLAEAETISVDATTEGVGLDLTVPAEIAIDATTTSVQLDLAEAESIALTVLDAEPVELALTESVIALEVVGQVGPPGPQGPMGPAGPAGQHWRHEQSVPATVWVVEHNLGYFPTFAVQDSAGTVVYGDPAYIDENTMTFTFSAPFAGYVNLG